MLIKRLISVLFGVLLAVAPSSVRAQFTYATNGDNTVTITAYSGGGGALVIPSTNTSGQTVSGIAKNAFDGAALTSVIISATVTNIGVGPFVNCFALTNISVQAGNSNYVGDGGVLLTAGETCILQYPCGLAGSYTVSNTVLTVTNQAFASCSNLTGITFADSVTTIGPFGFLSCTALNSVTLPASLITLGTSSFGYCSNLTYACFEGNYSSNFNPMAFTADPLTNVFYASTATGWGTNFNPNPVVGGLPTTPCLECSSNGITVTGKGGGALQVTITPDGAVSNGARWQVDGGTFQASGVLVSNLATGSHLVAFAPAPGWNPPADEFVSVTNSATTALMATYLSTSTVSANGLVLVTNGSGTITHSAWPQELVTGKPYTVKALPKTGNLFQSWVGGSNIPYTVLSTSASYTFTMQSNLLLEANFVTNIFLTAHGSYYGLFGPDISARQQTDSGYFTLSVAPTGAVSGRLTLGSTALALSGKISPNGNATITTARHGASSLTTTLQLDLVNQGIAGTVGDGSTFTSTLNGFLDVFSSHVKATAYQGHYTLEIPGTSDRAMGPLGTSYGTVTVSATGGLSFSGSLADGTAVSQSTVISSDGMWPFYVSLYGGKGSLWGWNYLTNGTIVSPAGLSWINETNASKTADYRVGFTNQAAVVNGFAYTAAQPPLALTSGEAVLQGGGIGTVISNSFILSPTGKITLSGAEDTNKLILSINKTTGLITGTFRNPVTAKTVKVGGVILQGQTNAEGYFLGTNGSGTFTLDPP